MSIAEWHFLNEVLCTRPSAYCAGNRYVANSRQSVATRLPLFGHGALTIARLTILFVSPIEYRAIFPSLRGKLLAPCLLRGTTGYGSNSGVYVMGGHQHLQEGGSWYVKFRFLENATYLCVPDFVSSHCLDNVACGYDGRHGQLCSCRNCVGSGGYSNQVF